MSCAALIVAAGSGSRARRNSDNVAKQYVEIGGKPVLQRTIEIFLTNDQVDSIQVVIGPHDEQLYRDVIAPLLEGPHCRRSTRQAAARSRGRHDTPDFGLQWPQGTGADCTASGAHPRRCAPLRHTHDSGSLFRDACNPQGLPCCHARHRHHQEGR